MDKEMTAGDLTGYVHFKAYTGGYTCANCGAWVQWNQYHACYPVTPQTWVSGWQPTWQSNYGPVLDEIKELLTRLIELLSQEE